MTTLNQPRTIAPVIRGGYNGSGSTIVKGKFVKTATSPSKPYQIALCTAATDLAIGVAMHDIPTGEVGDIQVGGVALVRAGGAIASPPGVVTSDADGDGVIASTGNQVYGTALTAAGAAGDFIEVELKIGGTPSAAL